MDEADVRERADAMCSALVDGDVGRATEAFSRELQQHLGEVITLFPLPATEATVDSVERGASSGFTVVIRGWSERTKRCASRHAGRIGTGIRPSSKPVT